MKTMMKTMLMVIMMIITTLSYAQSTLTFSVIVGVETKTVNHYGGFAATQQLVLDQMTTVNGIYNNGGGLDYIMNFSVDSIYEFVGDGSSFEANKAHPNFDFRVAIDGFPAVGGGWFGGSKSIFHSWSVDFFGGPFAQHATSGLAHEFGHSRGALDLYKLEVAPENNPISGEGYEAVTSIMNYPYDFPQIWDEHSINIINVSGAVIDTNPVESSFPTIIGVKAINTDQVPIPGASVKLYPVDWDTQHVLTTPIVTGTTNALGEFVPTSNPFGANVQDKPWHVGYPNILVEVAYGDVTEYAWMSLDEVQNKYFENEDFYEELVLDVSINEVYEVDYTILGSWNGGYTAQITITNNSSSTISGWNLNFDLPTSTVSHAWNANVTAATQGYLATDYGWNGTIGVGQSVSFGFNGAGTPGVNASAQLNGIPVTFAPSGAKLNAHQENLDLGLRIFPNPASSQVTIEGEEVTRVELMNTQGQVVLNQVPVQHTIFVEEVERGFYTMVMYTATGSQQTKLVLK